MPESRHRKVNRARKRPRVASSNPNVSVKPPAGGVNQRLIAILVIAALAMAVIAYFLTSRGGSTQTNTQTDYETTTASGLKIHDITVGTGATPQAGQTVVVHYIGWLENGTEFNNSYKMGGPISFTVDGVIKGWTEALLMMPVGSKWKLYVPYHLGYGPGQYQTIPGGSALVFEIDLLAIEGK